MLNAKRTAARTWVRNFAQIDAPSAAYLDKHIRDLSQHQMNIDHMEAVLNDAENHSMQYIADSFFKVLAKYNDMGRVAGPLMFGLEAIGSQWDAHLLDD